MANRIDGDSAAAIAAEAARRAAEEAARRAAEEAAKRAAEEAAKTAAAEAAKAQQSSAAKNQPQNRLFNRDTFTPASSEKAPMQLDGAAAAGSAAATGQAALGKAPDADAKPVDLPKNPDELPKIFPELGKRPKDELKKTYDSLQKVVSGDPSKALTALGELAKQYPQDVEKMLKKLNIADNRVAKIATNSDALKALGTLADKDAKPVDKAKAVLDLAKAAGDTLKPEELKGYLKHALNGIPAAQKLIDAVTTWSDPSKSGLDKAKATLELANALKEFTGKDFPQLANDLRKLDGSFKALSSALTLVDPSASPADKITAAVQLAAELPDLKSDLTAFKDKMKELLKSAGVKDADQVAEGAAKQVAESAVKGLDPKLAEKLTEDQKAKLTKLADKVGKDELAKVLPGITDPKALDGLMGQLDKLKPEEGKRLLTMVGGMEHGALGEVLSNPEMAESLGKLSTKIDDAGAKTFAKISKDVGADTLKSIFKFTDMAPAGVLKDGLKALDPVIDKFGGKAVGKSLQLLDKLVGKMGVKITEEVVTKTLKTLVKIVPLVGAVPNAIDAAHYFDESMKMKDKNKDLGYFALIAGKLNAVDALAGTAMDLTGVGAAADLAVGTAFGVAELAMDLAYDSEKAKYEKDPAHYQAPDWMKGVNAAVGGAGVLTGDLSLVSYYGPAGARDLAEWATARSLKGSVELDKQLGIAAANATGQDLKLTADGLHSAADIIRNPSKYSDAVKAQASDLFKKAEAAGGELSKAADKEMDAVIADAKKVGKEGLATLQYIAKNPGKAAQKAVDAINDVVTSAAKATTAEAKELYKEGVKTLTSLEKDWQKLDGAARKEAGVLLDKADKAISAGVDKLVSEGEKDAEILAWAASHPVQTAEIAKQRLNDVLAAGGEEAHKAWNEITALGDKADQLMTDSLNSLRQGGEKAVETLQWALNNPGQARDKVEQLAGQALSDIAHRGGEAARKAAEAIKGFVDQGQAWAKNLAKDLLKQGVESMKEVAKAWEHNLTEGGKEVLGGVEDLAGAVKDRAKRFVGYIFG